MKSFFRRHIILIIVLLYSGAILGQKEILYLTANDFVNGLNNGDLFRNKLNEIGYSLDKNSNYDGGGFSANVEEWKKGLETVRIIVHSNNPDYKGKIEYTVHRDDFSVLERTYSGIIELFPDLEIRERENEAAIFKDKFFHGSYYAYIFTRDDGIGVTAFFTTDGWFRFDFSEEITDN